MTRTADAAQSGPQRTCVGCRKVTASAELLRFVYTDAGVRQGRTLPGRGVWLCRDRECLDKSLGRGTLSRSLRIGSGRVDPETVRAEFDRATGHPVTGTGGSTEAV